jgi:hypothetical protein
MGLEVLGQVSRGVLVHLARSLCSLAKPNKGDHRKSFLPWAIGVLDCCVPHVNTQYGLELPAIIDNTTNLSLMLIQIQTINLPVPAIPPSHAWV